MFEAEVKRGIAWLDANIPGWLDKIDLERLDLRVCDRCVVGQVLGSYNNLFDATAPAWEDRFAMGFNARIPFGNSILWQDLTNQWKKQIKARLQVRELVYA